MTFQMRAAKKSLNEKVVFESAKTLKEGGRANHVCI